MNRSPADNVSQADQDLTGGPVESCLDLQIRTESVVAGQQSAVVDLGRELRCGFGEAIYGEGKSVELIRSIVQTQLDAGQRVLVTRIDLDAGLQLESEFPNTFRSPIGRTLQIENQAFAPPSPASIEVAHIAVISAGSTDAAVAEETIATLNWMRIPYRSYNDIGVAGPQRLQQRISEIRHSCAVVVIAGMEGALPSVVAGHVATPVIAVPTSVGYGANLQGITPLLSALASCAPGVMTVGIDAGFKGGYCAGLIWQNCQPNK